MQGMPDKLQFDSAILLSLIDTPCTLCGQLISESNSIQTCECDGFVHHACIKQFIENLFEQHGIYRVFCKVCLAEVRVSVKPKCKLAFKKSNCMLAMLALTMVVLCLIKLGQTIYAKWEDSWAIVHVALLFCFTIILICVAFFAILDMCFGKQYQVVEVQKTPTNNNCSIQITVVRKQDNKIPIQTDTVRDTDIRYSGAILKNYV